MNYPWSSPKNKIIQNRKEMYKTMIKADNEAIDFVMRIVNNVLEREISRRGNKIRGIDMMNMRLELWYCFMEQYVVKRCPKSGLLVLEIV